MTHHEANNFQDVLIVALLEVDPARVEAIEHFDSRAQS